MVNPGRQLPVFSIDNIPIFGDTILSPMDGYSDLPFRSLARRLGSAMSYTEFINAIDVVNKNPYIEKRLEYVEAERPVFIEQGASDRRTSNTAKPQDGTFARMSTETVSPSMPVTWEGTSFPSGPNTIT